MQTGIFIVVNAFLQRSVRERTISHMFYLPLHRGTLFSQCTGTFTSNTNIMTEKLTNPTMKKLIEALNAGNQQAWNTLFTANAEFYNDGYRSDLKQFTAGAFGLGKERFSSIDKVENNGLDIYGRYYSHQRGSFRTYFKLRLDAIGKITRLEAGQAKY